MKKHRDRDWNRGSTKRMASKLALGRSRARVYIRKLIDSTSGFREINESNSRGLSIPTKWLLTKKRLTKTDQKQLHTIKKAGAWLPENYGFGHFWGRIRGKFKSNKGQMMLMCCQAGSNSPIFNIYIYMFGVVDHINIAARHKAITEN